MTKRVLGVVKGLSVVGCVVSVFMTGAFLVKTDFNLLKGLSCSEDFYYEKVFTGLGVFILTYVVASFIEGLQNGKIRRFLIKRMFISFYRFFDWVDWNARSIRDIDLTQSMMHDMEKRMFASYQYLDERRERIERKCKERSAR